MRLCRFIFGDKETIGFFFEDGAVPLADAAARCSGKFDLLADADHLLHLTPGGELSGPAHRLASTLTEDGAMRESLLMPFEQLELLAPIAAPPKILLLAGNYAAHIEEEGQIALERAETFPYVFMKPHTALNHPGAAIPIPAVSPDRIDYECELGVVIGRQAKRVTESEALEFVAGYTVVNDISDRQYKPFPERKAREKDAFFDWLHGKWHDGFCPMGPCLASAQSIPDPQDLRVTLHVNDEPRQDGSTAQMIFPVAAIVSFLSQSMTLMPGDVIATGTPAGVGAASGRFLTPGDELSAAVEGIGVLRNVMVRENEP